MPDYVVAIDLGGTHVRAATFDREGPPTQVIRGSSEAAKGRDYVIDRIVALVQELIAKQSGPPRAIALAAPGPLDPFRGVVFPPPNMPGWPDETPLAAMLTGRLNVPVVVGNDANLAAVGEHRSGAGRGITDMIYLTVSTGIGGGLICDGKLLLGSGGLAGEPGHMQVTPDGPRCGCGRYGHLEALASGTSIARIANERLAAGAASTLTGTVTTVQIVQAAQAGDTFALKVITEAATWLGIGIVNLLHLFDPALVVIGGGVSNAGPLLFDPVLATIQTHAMPRYAAKARVVRAALGDDAGIYGAAAVAWEVET